MAEKPLDLIPPLQLAKTPLGDHGLLGHVMDRDAAALNDACGAAMKGPAEYDPSWVDEAETLSAVLDEDW